MERQFYTDNFEQLLKEKSDEFRMYPSKRVWHSIYNDLHPGRKWPSVAVSMLLIIALLMVGYWNNKSTPVTLVAAAQKNHNAIPSSGRIDDGTTNTTAAQSNSSSIVTGPANVQSTTAQDQQLTAFNNTTRSLSASQNQIAADKNNTTTNSAGSALADYNKPASPSFTAPLNHIITSGDHTVTIISGNDIAETGTTFNNSQKPVTGNIDDNPGNTGTAKGEVIAAAAVTASISNAELSSLLQQNAGSKARVSADFNVANIIVAAGKNNVSISLIPENKDNNEEEVITAITGNDITNNLKTGGTVANSAETPASISNTGEEANTTVNKESKPSSKVASAATKKITSAQDKEWIEDYAFHNKSKRKKWQDRTAFEFYITPGVGHGKLSSDAKYDLPSIFPSFANGATTVPDANKAVSENLGLGLEAGFSIDYSLAKKLVVKAGVQGNYTSYGIKAYETNHPILTTLMFVDPNTDFAYLHSASTTLSNIRGAQPVVLHNRTYQVSIPLGFAYKLAGNTNKLAWYTGATIQPTFVAGGKAYVISADRNNYVADGSLIRKWNLNTGVETYITYKFDGFTLQAGPQFRYQLLSTYYKKYTVNETLSNVGIKLGLIKNF